MGDGVISPNPFSFRLLASGSYCLFQVEISGHSQEMARHEVLSGNCHMGLRNPGRIIDMPFKPSSAFRHTGMYFTGRIREIWGKSSLRFFFIFLLTRGARCANLLMEKNFSTRA
jgi:hypothetical protein